VLKFKKEFFKNTVRLKIQGVNLKRLIKNIYKSDFEIYNLNQISSRELHITIKANKYKKFIDNFKNYNIEITKRYGLNFLGDFSLKHLGLIIGIFIFLAVNILSSKILMNIKVVGLERINEAEIRKTLKNSGIFEGKFLLNIDTKNLAKNLENNFDDISFVSVFYKGNSLIINIKEKLFIEELENTCDIVAKNNGVITKLEVVQGKTNFKVGDIVKAGDVIIEGKINDISVQAIGSVEMKVWYSASKTFYENETVRVRTDKSFTNSYFKFYDNKFKIKEHKNKYEFYEIETNEHYIFKNLLIPIKIYKENYYELKEISVKNDFNLQKHDIIEETKNEALKSVPKGMEVLDIKTEISETQNGKIITTYIETLQKLF